MAIADGNCRTAEQTVIEDVEVVFAGCLHSNSDSIHGTAGLSDRSQMGSAFAVNSADPAPGRSIRETVAVGILHGETH